jgi:hypothetical protein
MMESNQKNTQPRDPLVRYFAGITENTFQSQLGIVDTNLVDYLSDLLVRFIRSDAVNRIRGVTGRPLMSVTEMAAEASARLGNAKRELHRHIGDFTMFWAGVFPEALRRPSKSPEQDQFESYLSHGKRAYYIAAQIECDEDNAPEGPVLERLSQRFELCVYGLREVRREWEESDDGFGGHLLLN